MTTGLIVSIVFNCIFLVGLVASLSFNARLAKFAMAFEDNVNVSLDELDNSYKTISQILETPLAYDSREVRQVLAEIDIARRSILRAARRITSKEVIREEETKETN
jgi:hypothetical protein